MGKLRTVLLFVSALILMTSCRLGSQYETQTPTGGNAVQIAGFAVSCPTTLRVGDCLSCEFLALDSDRTPINDAARWAGMRVDFSTADLYLDDRCSRQPAAGATPFSGSGKIYFVAKKSGEQKITISEPSSRRQQDVLVSFSPGAPATIAIDGPVSAAAFTCVPMAYVFRDRFGNETPPGALTNISLNSSNPFFQISTFSDCSVVASTISTNLARTPFYFYGRDVARFNFSATTSLGQIGNGTLDVLDSNVPRLSIVAGVFNAGQCTVMDVRLRSAFGTPVAIASDTNLTLSRKPVFLNVYASSDCSGNTVNSLRIPANLPEVRFSARSNLTFSEFLELSSQGLASASYLIKVNAGAPASIDFTNLPLQIGVGVCGSGTLTVRDSFGNAVPRPSPSPSPAIFVTAPQAVIYPATNCALPASTFIAGAGGANSVSFGFRFGAALGGQRITAALSGISAVSPPISVSPTPTPSPTSSPTRQP